MTGIRHLALSMSLLVGLFAPLASLADEGLAEADNLLTANKYKQAEEAYRGLLGDDTTGDAYAGLAVSLAKQSWPAKVLDAERTLRKAKSNFPDNPNLMAAGG